VIMTPTGYVYFDYTQTKNEDSVTIGGYIPIEKVYAYEPVPKELDSSKAKFIEGAQANLWTEYIKNPRKVEYMVFPRMSALSEVLWSPKEKRNWSDFEKRLQTQFKRYDLWKANYSKAYFDLTSEILPITNYKGVLWQLDSRCKDCEILLQDFPKVIDSFFSMNTPVRYGQPIRFESFEYDKMIAHLVRKTISGYDTLSSVQIQLHFNKATGKKVSITIPPNSKYPGQGGAFSLVNGVYSNKGLSYPDWLGWVGDNMEATIDLGEQTSFDSVRIHTLDQNGSWVYLPQYVEVLISNDRNNFTSVGKSSTFVGDTLTMGWINVQTPKQSSRYIRVVAKNYGLIPDGKPGGGNKAWLFADEVQVH